MTLRNPRGHTVTITAEPPTPGWPQTYRVDCTCSPGIAAGLSHRQARRIHGEHIKDVWQGERAKRREAGFVGLDSSGSDIRFEEPTPIHKLAAKTNRPERSSLPPPG